MKAFLQIYLLVMGFLLSFSAVMYGFSSSDEWFSRLAVSLICFGFYTLSEKNEKKDGKNG